MHSKELQNMCTSCTLRLVRPRVREARQVAHGVHGQCTQNSARKKKLSGNDELEYFHVHQRILLKVRDEAVPGLRHKGIYERSTSRPGRSTLRTTPRYSLNRRLDGHQSMSGRFKEKKNHSPCPNPGTSGP